MEVNSLFRMMRANAMDTDNKSHRACVRWDDSKRREMWKLSRRDEGNAPQIARVVGMSTTAVRREAKRLGITLQPMKGKPEYNHDPFTFVYRTMLTHLAISLGTDASKVGRDIGHIARRKVVDDDAKLKPLLKEHWVNLVDFAYIHDSYSHYKINDITDGVLKLAHNVYKLDTISTLLRSKASTVQLRCRELGTASRDSEGLPDVAVEWLYRLHLQGVAPATLVEVTGLSLQCVKQLIEHQTFWRQLS